MKNGYLFTYIIGYRHSNERFNNLKRVLEWLTGFGGIEIIIIEQDKTSKLSSFTLKGVKHIFTKSNSPYNRSWAFNVGIEYSTTDTICFGDSDLIMDPQDMINSLKELERYDCVSPYRSVLDLTREESSLQFDRIKSINRPGRGENDHQKINLCGGIVIYKKESIEKIGGWCEDFIGWGGEDNFQEIKTKKFLTSFEMPYKCYHLWHERLNIDQNLYSKTLELLNKLSSLNDNDLKVYINSNKSKYGMKNKYDR